MINYKHSALVLLLCTMTATTGYADRWENLKNQAEKVWLAVRLPLAGAAIAGLAVLLDRRFGQSNMATWTFICDMRPNGEGWYPPMEVRSQGSPIGFCPWQGGNIGEPVVFGNFQKQAPDVGRRARS